mmetsp:Transcript_128077/g.362543  ORF Transcript_128077/g.362543 Transcript_128077/m.362543 type:complete len:270 (-) Transcript_128077:21-830(-)
MAATVECFGHVDRADDGTPVGVSLEFPPHLLEHHRRQDVGLQRLGVGGAYLHLRYDVLVERQDRVPLLVVEPQPRADLLLGVVRPLDDAGLDLRGRGAVLRVVHLPVERVDPSARYSLDHDVVGDIQVDDGGDLDPAGGQGLCLPAGPREAVEQHPVLGAVRLRQPLLQHVGHDAVRHELAIVHVLRELWHELLSRAQEVPDRHGHHAVLLRHQLRERALARGRRAEQDHAVRGASLAGILVVGPKAERPRRFPDDVGGTHHAHGSARS